MGDKSMKDGHSINEPLASELAKSTPALEANNSELQALDRGRRRLLRGGAAIAPVVLTLRSGALAAAASGCVQVVDAGTITDTKGTISSPPPPGYSSPSPGNACITNASQGKCGQGLIQHGTYSNYRVVHNSTSNTDECRLNGDPNGTPLSQGNGIALISIMAVSSLIP